MSFAQLAEANVAEIPDSEQILCFYANSTSQMQIAWIEDTPTCHLEKVIFPGQRLLFEAVPEAQLEIQTFSQDKENRTARIRCRYLQVNESQAINFPLIGQFG